MNRLEGRRVKGRGKKEAIKAERRGRGDQGGGRSETESL
jgi:hypothetical protein